MVLAKMDLYKYHNVYMYFSMWLLVPIPQQVAWSVAMTVYNIFIVMCHSTLLFDTYYMKCCCVNICKGLK